MLVEVLIMAPASGPHRAGRIPRGDTAGMNPPGPALLPEEDAGAGGGPGTCGDPNADPTARDPTARPPATRPPGPAIDAALSWRASAARDPTARAVVVVVRTARDLCDRADALREHVT